MSAVVPFWPLGTKRIRSVFRSNKDDASETVPRLDQLFPLSSEYCHCPFPVWLAVIAIPSTAPLSASVIRSPPAERIMLDTVWPTLFVSSSVLVIKVIRPLLSRTGASLVDVIETVVRAVTVSGPPVPCAPELPSLKVHCRMTLAGGASLALL